MARKLVITIPCLNEEKTIAQVIRSIPKKIAGIEKIEVIVIDDGSTDKTAQVARQNGAKVILHRRNLGLARTFEDGIKEALHLKADLIVNTDGDNQYDQREISKLVRPILENRAEMVLGDRQIKKLTHMPKSKKIGNLLGSWVIRLLTGTKVNDASTGFRAFSREIARSFEYISGHTYTHETIIHAHFQQFRIEEIPVHFKKRRGGKSRLIKNLWQHVKLSGAIIVRTIVFYQALNYLFVIGILFCGLSLIGFTRFLIFFIQGNGDGHVQSLIFASVLFNTGISSLMIGILADLIRANHRLIKNQHDCCR